MTRWMTIKAEYARQRRMKRNPALALWNAVSYALEPCPF
jgi:hypothetical protein